MSIRHNPKYILYRAKLRQVWLGATYCNIIGDKAFDLLVDTLYERGIIISNLIGGATTCGIVSLHGYAAGEEQVEFDAIWTAKWMDDHSLISLPVADYDLHSLEIYPKRVK